MEKEDPEYFNKVYELLKQNINGNNGIKKCRFCDQSEPTVGFNTRAHIIPELLGRNNRITADECDTCNTRIFSAYESHLATFFRPYFTMLGVEGKKSVPVFQSRSIGGDNLTTTTIEYTNEGHRKIVIGNENDIQIDDKNKTLIVTFRLPNHKPIFVYKALLKIAMSLLPKNDVIEHKHIIEFLRKKENNFILGFQFPIVFITVLGKKFASPGAHLYRAKIESEPDGYIPKYTLVISFGNIVAQIFIPPSISYLLQNKPKDKTAVLNLFHSFIYNINYEKIKELDDNELINVQYKFSSINLSSSISKPYDIKLYFKYDSLEKH
ncbi:MAG: hypothetical protein H3C54_01185 [Taibaiella sp.]|nr:hypothetical protein [Taibaiella sp.]